MTDPQWWDDLTEQTADRLQLPSDATIPALTTLAGDLFEYWMEDARRQCTALLKELAQQRFGSWPPHPDPPIPAADWKPPPIPPIPANESKEQRIRRLKATPRNLNPPIMDIADAQQAICIVLLASIEEGALQMPFDPPNAPARHITADKDNGNQWLFAHTFHNIHEAWQACPDPKPGHPLMPLIEAWLIERPEPIQLDSRETGIIPIALAKTPARYSSDTGAALFDLSEFERAPAGEALIIPDTQAHLPGLGPQPSTLVPVLAFLIWDHNIPASRGRGAPYGLRLWVEALLSLPPGQPYRRQEFRIPWGKIVDHTLAGRGNKKNTERLWQALHTVHNLRLAWGEPGARTGRAAVQVPDIPQTPTEYGAIVRFVVELPPGAGNGPLVYKPFLRKIARWSAPAYRAALTLAYLWDQHGTRKGRYIQPTIPRLARDAAGRLIGRDGQIITAKDGNPIANYMIGSGRNRRLHPAVLPLDTNAEIVSSIQAAARERNPAADRYPILRPSDLVKLCYPDAQVTQKPIKDDARRKRQQRAGQVLQEMAERTYLNIEETPNGWRILPPDRWGAGFRSDGQ